MNDINNRKGVSEVLQEPRVQLICGLNRTNLMPTSVPTTSGRVAK
jgi:hypothetical protein